MHRNFDVNWKGICYACQNPLDLYISFSIEDDNFLRDFSSFYGHKPICTIVNTSIFKTRDCKAYKYCFACYISPVMDIRSREIGHTIQQKYTSLRKEEIYEWFKDLHTYLNRPDVDDHVIYSVPRRFPNGLDMVLTD
jgi:hypothetical protein